jgi:hypothetical protein
MTISGYLDEFRKSNRRKRKFLNNDTGDLRRDVNASHSVITTWKISFEQIREERQSAADLLSLMSFFNPQKIPEWVLSNYARSETGMNNKKDVEEDNEGDSEKDGIGDANDEFNEDLVVLQAYSLVTATEENDMWEIHPLVQFSTKIWLSSNNDMENWEGRFSMLMLTEFPNGDFKNWSKCQQLFPHVEPLLNNEPADRELVIGWATLLINAALYMWTKGSYKVAEDTVVKAIMARERILGEVDLDTLTSINNRAVVLGD